MNQYNIIGVYGNKNNNNIVDYALKYNYLIIPFDDILEDIYKMSILVNEKVKNDEKENIVENEVAKIIPDYILRQFNTDRFRYLISGILEKLEDNFLVECIKYRIHVLRKNNNNQKLIITNLIYDNEIKLVKHIYKSIIIQFKNNKNQNDKHKKHILIDLWLEPNVSMDLQLMTKSKL